MKLSINNKNERVRSYDAIAVPCSCSSAYSRGSTRRHGWFDQEPPMKRRARSWCLLARSLFFFPVERRDRRSICPDSRALARRITVVTHWIPRVSSNKGISDRSIDVTQVAARAVTGGQVVTGFACYYLLASASQQHKAEGTRPKRTASPRPVPSRLFSCFSVLKPFAVIYSIEYQQWKGALSLCPWWWNASSQVAGENWARFTRGCYVQDTVQKAQ